MSKATMIEALYTFLDSNEVYKLPAQEIFNFLMFISKRVKLSDEFVENKVKEFYKLDGFNAAAEIYKYLKRPMSLVKAKKWVEENVI